MACEDCPVRAALIPVLEALDWFLYGGNAQPEPIEVSTGFFGQKKRTYMLPRENRFSALSYQDVNEFGAPIHEALLKLKGEAKT